jgi:hypothetical protein
MQRMGLKQRLTEGANTKAVRVLMIGLAALVVLSVSGYGTVIYIQLMSKVFPTGPLLIACYMGAAANLVLMLVLLVGKFVWFRPGAHEVASWIVTGVELLVAILNMMLAYQLARGEPLSSFLAAWYYLAPISPVFSMVGAIVLIMTSSELRKKHHALEIEEQKERAEREFDLAMHDAEMEVKHSYLGYVKNNLVDELNAPERQQEMKNHASVLVAQVLSGISGLSSVPRLARPAQTVVPVVPESLGLDEDSWLAQVNERVEQERRRRFAQEAEPVAEVQPVVSVEEEDGQAARLARLAAAAQARGYSLDRLEQLLGVEQGGAKKNG